MSDLRKAAEMALEALESVYGKGKRCEAAINALRQALAQPDLARVGEVGVWGDSQALAQSEQEPVAWMHNFIEGNVIAHKPADISRYPDRWTALYKDQTLKEKNA